MSPREVGKEKSLLGRSDIGQGGTALHFGRTIRKVTTLEYTFWLVHFRQIAFHGGSRRTGPKWLQDAYIGEKIQKGYRQDTCNPLILLVGLP